MSATDRVGPVKEVQSFETGAPMTQERYLGKVGQTRVEAIHYSCSCGALFSAGVYRAVNATRDPEAAERLRSGTLNRVVCPACGKTGEAHVSVVYHDEEKQRFLLVLPETGRHGELRELAELFHRIAEEPTVSVPLYVKQPEVVFGAEGLSAALGRERASSLPMSLDLLSRADELARRSRELDEREVVLVGREAALAEQRREVAEVRLEQARVRQELERRAEELAQRERELLRREEAATRRDAELNDRESRLREREARVNAREEAVAQLEEQLREREASLKVRSQTDAGLVGTPEGKGHGGRSGEEALPFETDAGGQESKAFDTTPPVLLEGTKDAVPFVAAGVPSEARDVASESESAEAAADDEEPTPLPKPEPPPPDEVEEEPELFAAPPQGSVEERAISQTEPSRLPADFGDETPDITVRGPAPLRSKEETEEPLLVREWLASGRKTLARLMAGVPRVLVLLSEQEAGAFLGPASPRVVVQLHRLPTYPLVVVGVVAADADESGRPSLVVPLDPLEVEQRAFLDRLAVEFRLLVDMYGPGHVLLASQELRAPLAENVRYILSLAEEHLKTIPLPQRSFADAQHVYLSDTFDRFGVRAAPFTEESFETLRGAAATREAVALVDTWSQDESEAYLLLVRSFPLAWWRRIRVRVLSAAVEHGIALSPRLEALAVAHGVAQNRRDLWTRLLAAATAMLKREKPCDFTPEAERENWSLILRACEELHLPVEQQVTDMVAALKARGAEAPPRRTLQGMPVVRMPPPPPPPPRKRAPEPAALAESKGEVQPIPGVELPPPVVGGLPPMLQPELDLSDRTTAELLMDLEKKDVRKDAALELCRRGAREHLPAIFAAVRRMTRGEAIRVLPALVRFGLAAEPFFVEGLEARKSFLRQGCALALGTMKATESTDALVTLLIQEPTEIWREVARALGDIGRASVMSLAARVREADEEGRERIAVALAHVVARGHKSPVETLARGRDHLAARCAQRALEKAEEIRQQDEEVRGKIKDSPRETTMVRSFTRQFFESLDEGEAGQEIVELDASELEEAEDSASDEDGGALLVHDGSDRDGGRSRGRGPRQEPPART